MLPFRYQARDFMDPDTYEQVTVAGCVLVDQARLLAPDAPFPDVFETNVVGTAPPTHRTQGQHVEVGASGERSAGHGAAVS